MLMLLDDIYAIVADCLFTLLLFRFFAAIVAGLDWPRHAIYAMSIIDFFIY